MIFNFIGAKKRESEKRIKNLKEEIKKAYDFFLEAIGIRKTEIEEISITEDEIKELLSSRRAFSKYVMPVAYDEERGIYINQDGTIGIMYECVPVLFSSPQAVKTLSSVFTLNFPKNSIIQFIMYADSYIEHFLIKYVTLKARADEFPYLKKACQNMTDFYRNMKNHLGFPARHFRVFFTLKFPPPRDFTDNDLKELKTAIREILQASYLQTLEVMPQDLLFFMRFLLNDVKFEVDKETENLEIEEVINKTKLLYQWIPNVRLNRQIIKAETDIESGGSYVRFGKKKFRCLTWKTMPENIDFVFGNMITGIYDLSDGVAGDVKQVPTPFFAVLNIFCDSINTELQTKANLMLQQQPLGTYIIALKEKIDEYLWAVKQMNDGKRFMRGFLVFWVFSEDDDELRKAVHKYVRILESLGGNVQEETVITMPLFIYSLPFGGICDKTNFLLLDRDFVFTAETASASAPVQADFMGTGEPVLLFLGRKGQVVGIDLFSRKSSSYNFLIAAPTGSGKSFLVNYIVTNYYGAGAKIRIVDIGGSYKKLVNMFGGKYLEFSPENRVCINPFSTIYDPEYDIPVVVQMLTTMATAVTEKLPEQVSSETAYNMIQVAVREVLKWAEEKNLPYSALSIDHVYEVLVNFMDYFPDADKLCGKDHCVDSFEKIASHLAFNLYKFTSRGAYGRWFVGENTFDISKDDFVVLELEHLKKSPDLFKVVTLSVLNAVTADLYLSDRSRPTLIVLDESWQFLQDNSAFEKVIEEGYRRARKYRGSFGVVTQDLLDIGKFGRVGDVIYTNSAFKFYLSGVKADLAKERKIVDLNDFVVNVLKSLKYNAPKYSEIFIDTKEFGSGVVRLIVDPYSYYVYTSEPAEISEIERMVKSGMTYDEAIREMIKKYREKEGTEK